MDKWIGLLSFAFGGVVLIWVVMYLFGVLQGFQGGVGIVRMWLSLGVFFSFLLVGYGLTQIVRQNQ